MPETIERAEKRFDAAKEKSKRKRGGDETKLTGRLGNAKDDGSSRSGTTSQCCYPCYVTAYMKTDHFELARIDVYSRRCLKRRGEIKSLPRIFFGLHNTFDVLSLSRLHSLPSFKPNGE